MRLAPLWRTQVRRDGWPVHSSGIVGSVRSSGVRSTRRGRRTFRHAEGHPSGSFQFVVERRSPNIPPIGSTSLSADGVHPETSIVYAFRPAMILGEARLLVLRRRPLERPSAKELSGIMRGGQLSAKETELESFNSTLHLVTANS